MKKETRLYIGGSEVELTEGLEILYNYSIGDVTDPTAVKNGFSKTVRIAGTPANNKIFGQYWNVERSVRYGSTNYGIYYNASKKAPFKLFINNEVFESGYVKLDKVDNTNDTVFYECTLYSDLGNFFINLNTNDNTGEKLKLSDLDYWTGGSDEFNFTVTGSTVKLAWDELAAGTDGKWQHINFMPAYNGLPSDFDCNKVVMNLSGTSLKQTDETGIFKAHNSVVLANLADDMNEWEMRDLRSYLQRPVVRMKSIINACCDPDQNGGYEVELDPDFFSSGNPYYEKTWLTLPLLQNLEYTNEEQVLVGSTLIGVTTTGDPATMMYQDLKFSLGDYGNTTPSRITVGAKVFCNNIFRDLNTEIDPFGIADALSKIRTPYTSLAWFWNRKGDSYHTGWWCLGSLYVQLIAMNGEVVVGASQAYNLTSPIRHNGKLYFGNNRHYAKEHQFKPYMDKTIYDILGQFEDDGFHGEGSNEARTLYFTIDNLNSPVSQLKIVYFWGATDDKIKHFSQQTLFDETEESSWVDIGGPDPGWISLKEAFPLTVGVTYTDLKAVMGASLGRTGTQVTKAMLLNTEYSPCEALLSYAKTFGLYFRKDVNENKIQILTRKTYYDRTNVVNLEKYIDRSHNIVMTPVAMTSKWYEFAHEKDETEWQKKYLEAKGVEYGIKVLNTGYEFNVDKKELFKDNIIRGGIEGLERSKFFSAYNNDNVLRTWMGMGLSYNLFVGSTATTVNVPVTIDSTSLAINEGEGMRYYDVYPKLQFHDKNGDPTDGNNVLVFFSGFKSVTTGRTNPLSYFISDDNMYQTLLNDGTPCWFFTPTEEVDGTPMAIKVDALPVFERYLTNEGGTNVIKSLDFGTPQELFVPNYSLSESACVYYDYWRRYIEDVCDPDTKILECYVRVEDKVNDEWLRRFYWFSNAVWRLESVIDYNAGSDGTTKMRFVKVQDIDNYTSMTQEGYVKIRLTASKYRVSRAGETISITVDCSDNENVAWRLLSPRGVVLSQTSGVGTTTINATIPANNDSDYKYFYYAATSNDSTANLTIQQEYDGDVDFTPSPSTLLVSSSGGSYIIDFSWKNQGQDYVESGNYATNQSEYSPLITADTSSRRTENKAILHVGENTFTDRTRETKWEFISHNGLRKSMIVVQMPLSVSFPSSGGQYCMGVQETGATVTTPYWLESSVSGNSVCFTAITNTVAERTGEVVITLPNGSSASTTFTQETGAESEFSVTPQNLYFPASGGTKYLTVKSKYPWYFHSGNGEWWSLSQTNSQGDAIIAVDVPANEGDERSKTALFTARDGSPTGLTQRVYISQLGTGYTGVTMVVTPSSTTVAGSGETVHYTITVNNLDGNWVTAYANSSNVVIGDIVFTGNTAGCDVVIKPNETENERNYSINFNLIHNGSTSRVVIASILQEIDGNFMKINPISITIPATGGTVPFFITTNVCWTATSMSDRIVESIGFAETDENENNYIDTGIHPTSATTMRIVYEGRGVNQGGLYIGVGGNDARDWRFFTTGGRTYFDYNNNRSWSSAVANRLNLSGITYDITMSLNTLTNNLEGRNIFKNEWSGEFLGSGNVLVDVGTIWVKEVEIKDGDMTVFHGIPHEENGVVGLYDSVSNTMKTLYSGSSGTIVANYTEGEPSWLTLSTTSGCGSDTTYLSVSAGVNAGNTRTATITLTNGDDITKTVTVIQNGDGATLIVTPTVLEFDTNGGTATITITSNINWTIE